MLRCLHGKGNYVYSIMKGHSENILLIGLATLVGWNVAVLTWFLLAMAAAALMSQVGYMGGLNKIFFIVTVLIAIAVGVIVGKKLYPKFKLLKFKWRMGWLIVLVMVTVMLFPRPFTYIIG